MLKISNVLATAIIMAGLISTSHAAETDTAKARGKSIGTAIVSSQATGDCPSSDRGASATGSAPGTDHAACTAAKNAARETLRGKVNKACPKYITSTKPCEVIN